jgi:TIR domain
MRRWFLSYTSQDFALTQALKLALQRRDAQSHIFFAPEAMRAGGFWQQQLADEIAQSSAFALLVGEHGVGPWQVMEYYEALDRRAKEPNYPLILILSAKHPAPGLPFARQLHWVVSEDPASEATVGKLIDAASGLATRPGELWRHTRQRCDEIPHRGDRQRSRPSRCCRGCGARSRDGLRPPPTKRRRRRSSSAHPAARARRREQRRVLAPRRTSSVTLSFQFVRATRSTLPSSIGLAA